MDKYIIAVVNSVSRWECRDNNRVFVDPLGMELIRDPVNELRRILKKYKKYGYKYNVRIKKYDCSYSDKMIKSPSLSQGWTVYVRHPDGTPLHVITCVKDYPFACLRHC